MTINASDRLWQMPFAAALASGLPLLVGAYFDRMDYGLVSSLGGMVFLSLPNTPLSHRMAGGVCLHSPRFRQVVAGHMRRLIPARLVP